MSYLERQAHIAELLRKEHFLEWLALYQDQQIVGASCEPSGCPIANYLLAHGYRERQVNSEMITANLTIIQTPQWAAQFIEAVDEAAPQITKARALELLAMG